MCMVTLKLYALWTFIPASILKKMGCFVSKKRYHADRDELQAVYEELQAVREELQALKDEQGLQADGLA